MLESQRDMQLSAEADVLSDGPLTRLRQIRERERGKAGHFMHSTAPSPLLLSIKAGGSAPACGCQAAPSSQHSPRHQARCPTRS